LAPAAFFAVKGGLGTGRDRPLCWIALVRSPVNLPRTQNYEHFEGILETLKEDKGRGITKHLSLIGWTVSDLGGVSTTLLIQAATGVGEVFGEALGTGMWITGN
jgi:hypothetical protein